MDVGFPDLFIKLLCAMPQLNLTINALYSPDQKRECTLCFDAPAITLPFSHRPQKQLSTHVHLATFVLSFHIYKTRAFKVKQYDYKNAAGQLLAVNSTLSIFRYGCNVEVKGVGVKGRPLTRCLWKSNYYRPGTIDHYQRRRSSTGAHAPCLDGIWSIMYWSKKRVEGGGTIEAFLAGQHPACVWAWRPAGGCQTFCSCEVGAPRVNVINTSNKNWRVAVRWGASIKPTESYCGGDLRFTAAVFNLWLYWLFKYVNTSRVLRLRQAIIISGWNFIGPLWGSAEKCQSLDVAEITWPGGDNEGFHSETRKVASVPRNRTGCNKAGRWREGCKHIF